MRIRIRIQLITLMRIRIHNTGCYLLPEVTKLNPWVSMATPVRWTCSSTYQLIKEDFPAEWFPEGGRIIITLQKQFWIRLKAVRKRMGAYQCFKSRSNPDPGFWWPKLKKKITVEKIWYFFYKKKLHFKTWNFLTSLHFCGSSLPSWIRIRVHWPD